jgi:copper homeostasis protein
MKIEISATSIESIKNAVTSGAERIELCSAYSLGGITPSAGIIKEAIELDLIPIHCLIRPREGHFFYNLNEIRVIEKDILFAKEAGCAGIVLGSLNKNRNLPLKMLEKFVQLAYPMELTFHRAFDLVNNPEKAMVQLINLGFNRILSSGQMKNAELGLPLLKNLLKQSEGNITIMPGAGINYENCLLFKEAEFKEIHLSGWKPILNSSIKKTNKNLKAFNHQIGVSDKKIIKFIVEKINC